MVGGLVRAESTYDNNNNPSLGLFICLEILRTSGLAVERKHRFDHNNLMSCV